MGGKGSIDYKEQRDKLYESIIKSINHINEFIDSLDFNQAEQRHILRYIQDIVLKLDNLLDQVRLVTSIELQKDKYPDVDFKFYLFYSKLGYKVGDDRDGVGNEDEGG